MQESTGGGGGVGGQRQTEKQSASQTPELTRERNLRGDIDQERGTETQRHKDRDPQPRMKETETIKKGDKGLEEDIENDETESKSKMMMSRELHNIPICIWNYPWNLTKTFIPIILKC